MTHSELFRGMPMSSTTFQSEADNGVYHAMNKEVQIVKSKWFGSLEQEIFRTVMASRPCWNG